ncbi:DNA repair protein [Bacillus alkalicellulosilyticus]|uniref:DNA repair protein n=1 Tax=Alkalihalobacterium alkalicellulosilyticum TaxID=1912214 RepID=UPI001FE3D7AE|nr:DNA repair protein [Bacillus alkalicellulosilyticus]
MMNESRRQALEQLSTASPLEITRTLEQFELYDMKSSQEVIDEIYTEFQKGENLEKGVLMPVMMSVINGLLEATKAGRSARKKGLTASRIIEECEQFSYNDKPDNSTNVNAYTEFKNVQETTKKRGTVNANMTQEYERNNYEDKKAMDRYKDGKVVGEKSLVDEYTGKRNLYLKRNDPNKRYNDDTYRQQAQPDHIVPLKQVHDRLSSNYALDDADIKKISNIEDNFAVTSANINQTKGKRTNAEYIKHMEEKGTPVDEITKANMLKMQKQAERKIDAQANKFIAKNLMDKTDKGKDIRNETAGVAANQAKEYAIGNLILFIVKPIYFELKDGFKNGLTKGVNASSALEALSIRFGRIKKHVIENASSFIGDNMWEFVKGFISSLIEGIISLFVGIFKQVLRLLKEGIKIFMQSAKILFGKDAKEMTPSQKGEAIIKIIGGSVLAIAGIGIETLLNKIGIGEPWSIVLATLLSGIASALFMYLLDKVDLFSVKAEQRRDRIAEIFTERIQDIKEVSEEFNVVAIQTLRKQYVQFEDIQSGIQSALATENLDSLNSGLYRMADFFKIELPYRNTDEFVDYFDSQDVIKL